MGPSPLGRKIVKLACLAALLGLVACESTAHVPSHPASVSARAAAPAAATDVARALARYKTPKNGVLPQSPHDTMINGALHVEPARGIMFRQGASYQMQVWIQVVEAREEGNALHLKGIIKSVEDVEQPPPSEQAHIGKSMRVRLEKDAKTGYFLVQRSEPGSDELGSTVTYPISPEDVGQ
jgi:hypothetical protein